MTRPRLQSCSDRHGLRRGTHDPHADHCHPARPAGCRARRVGGVAARRHRQSAAAAAAVGRAGHAGRADPPADGAGGGGGYRARGDRRLHHRRADRGRGRHPDRRERICRRHLQADAVLRVQHPQIDLPADVHPGVRHRLPAEGRLRRLHDGVRGADERGLRRGIGALRPHHGGALLRGHQDADPAARLCAEHAADPARGAAHRHDLQFHRRDDRGDVCLAHRHRPPDRQLGRELPDAAAVRRRDRAVGRGHPVQRSVRALEARCSTWRT